MTVPASNKFVQRLGSDNDERNLLVLQFGSMMHGYDSPALRTLLSRLVCLGV
jgi:hypothetical protein